MHKNIKENVYFIQKLIGDSFDKIYKQVKMNKEQQIVINCMRGIYLVFQL